MLMAGCPTQVVRMTQKHYHRLVRGCESKSGLGLQKPPLEVARSNQKMLVGQNMKVVRMIQKLYHMLVEG